MWINALLYLWFHTKLKINININLIINKYKTIIPVEKCDIFFKHLNSNNTFQVLYMNQNWKAHAKTFLVSLLAPQLQIQA